MIEVESASLDVRKVRLPDPSGPVRDSVGGLFGDLPPLIERITCDKSHFPV